MLGVFVDHFRMTIVLGMYVLVKFDFSTQHMFNLLFASL